MRRRGRDRDIYAAVLADERAWWASVSARLGHRPPNGLLDRLERGEPVEIDAHRLPGGAQAHGLRVVDSVVARADGTINVINGDEPAEVDAVVSFADERRRLRGPEVAP